MGLGEKEKGGKKEESEEIVRADYSFIFHPVHLVDALPLFRFVGSGCACLRYRARMPTHPPCSSATGWMVRYEMKKKKVDRQTKW